METWLFKYGKVNKDIFVKSIFVASVVSLLFNIIYICLTDFLMHQFCEMPTGTFGNPAALSMNLCLLLALALDRVC